MVAVRRAVDVLKARMGVWSMSLTVRLQAGVDSAVATS
jgi:hypothetical protein